MENELYHHGVLGMKWGVRRYQNKDGSLTAAGKRRMESISDKNQKVEYDNLGHIKKTAENRRRAQSNIHRNVAQDYNSANSGLNAASNASNKLSNMGRKSANKKRQKIARSIDVSKMSDAELRSYINRMSLESQYKNLKAQNISTGRDRVADVLDTAGDVLAVGASIAAIMVAIHTVRS